MLVSRAIMKFVPRGQTFTGEEPHPLDPRQEPLQGCGPVSAIGVIVDCVDDQSHTLGLTQHQSLLGFENTICVDSLCKLSHSIKPPVISLARAGPRIKFRAISGRPVSRVPRDYSVAGWQAKAPAPLPHGGRAQDFPL